MFFDYNYFYRGEIEEIIIESFGNDYSILDGYFRRIILFLKMYYIKGRLKDFKIYFFLLVY